jgi:predicted transcriptional regulator of viral defense system
MRKESFEAAQELIKDNLYSDNIKAYTTFDIKNIFSLNRNDWKIAGYRTADQFMRFLENKNIIKIVKLKHQSTGSIKKILTEPDATTQNIALTIKKDGYLSNYSSMQIHQLTLQIPKSLYISFNKSLELKDIKKSENEISQENIDIAFSKPQRTTSEVYRSEIDNTRFYFIQKAHKEKNIGIISKDNYSYTDLERTLIDIAVRPVYSGGVFEVLNAFEIAKENVDVNKLNTYLLELDYKYPYHQVIGFYMTKAGYTDEKVSLFSNYLSKYDFYLTYNMSNKEYDSEWKIYYPKGF